MKPSTVGALEHAFPPSSYQSLSFDQAEIEITICSDPSQGNICDDEHWQLGGNKVRFAWSHSTMVHLHIFKV